MALQTANKEYNSFIKGIITEANALTFPENASIDEANFVLNRDGSRKRRLGMDFEDSFTATAVSSMTSPTVAITSHEWINAGNTVANQFAVVQVGNKLLVYNAAASVISSSLITTIDASSVITDSSKEIQSESGMGFFFFTSGTGNPAVLEYVSGTVTLRQIQLRIRDYFGVYDGLAIDAMPTTLSTAHEYNLFNQGWRSAKITQVYNEANAGVNAYPSNAMIMYVMRDGANQIDGSKWKNYEFGTSAAARGKYIISAFDRSTDRNSLSGLSTVTDIETSRPACVGFAFQRVWYAGLDGKQVSATDTAPSMQGFVFYSRVVRTPQDFGQCYTDADPTAEIDNDVVETDGGYINIPDSGKIYKLVQLGNSLFVLAQNGVWAVSGDEGGFTATKQQVQKVTDFGALSGSSVVRTEDSVFYWNKAGIYVLGKGETGQLASQNITEQTIQSLFTALPKACKERAVGNFDAINRKVSWLYSTDVAYDGINYKYKYDTELVFDVTLLAITKNTISAITGNSPYLAGYLTTPDLISAASLGSSTTKYLALYYESGSSIPNITFAHYKDDSFVDWKSFNNAGQYFESYLLTGYELSGTSMTNKQAPYIIVHFNRTENSVESIGAGGAVVYDQPSSCQLQSRWDFSDSATSNKWGPLTEVYRLNKTILLPIAGEDLDYGQSVITTKNRLTGRGKALSLKFNSSNGYDMHILGWAVKYTGNTVV